MSRFSSQQLKSAATEEDSERRSRRINSKVLVLPSGCSYITYSNTARPHSLSHLTSLLVTNCSNDTAIISA